jgi:hypothetical protein
MAAVALDRLARLLAARPVRRQILAGLIAAALGDLKSHVGDEQAIARRRRRKRKKKGCRRGEQCSSGNCVRKKCRPAPGQGTCTIAVDVCGEPQNSAACSSVPSGEPSGNCFCFITTRGHSFCGSTGGCTPNDEPCQSDEECVASLGTVGSRCVQGPSCCGDGGTQCRRPCPTL